MRKGLMIHLRSDDMEVIVNTNDDQISENEMIGMLANSGGREVDEDYEFDDSSKMMDLLQVLWNKGVEYIHISKRRWS